jgi:hypothetical protein
MPAELRRDANGVPELVRTRERPQRKRAFLADLIEQAERQEAPWIVFADDKGRGVIRRDDDGEIEVMRLAQAEQTREPEHNKQADETQAVNLADDNQEPPTVNVQPMHDRLTPVREAQRLLGAPVIGSGLEIIRDGRARYVSTTALERMLASAGRGGRATASTQGMKINPAGKGAGELIGQHVDRAQKQRSRDSRSRRYRRASEYGRD